MAASTEDDSEQEIVPLTLEDPRSYLRPISEKIAWNRAITANIVAIALGGAVIVALPLHLLAIWLTGAPSESVASAFDKWYALISPLAGAALGAYYASDRVNVRKDG